MTRNEEITILVVEDDPGHARLIEKNLRRSKVTNEIIKFPDGQQALDYLFGEGQHSEPAYSLPILVMLDLNMPIVDGYQVLSRMKKDDQTKKIPVIILTTTDDPNEVARCYDLGCNVYVTKPVDYEKFSEAIHQLGSFPSVVHLPNGV